MRRTLRRALCAALIVVGLGFCLWSGPLQAAPSPVGERRLALVIGNGGYKEAPLKNPVNDSRAIAQRFKKLGFDVIALENATQAQMNKAITQFGERLTESGAAVFYYAGHGMQVKGRNFLLPVDAEITSETSVRNAAIDVEQLLEAIGEPSKRTNIVILDACRNNPFGRFRGGGGGLAQVSAPAGTLVAYATAPGMTASDGDGQNGAYTAEILKALDEPGLKVEDVFKKVRASVAQSTGNAQVPWEASSLVGDFYFVPKGSSVVVVPPGGQMPGQMPGQIPGQAPDQSVELAFWNSIKDGSDAALFKAYLEKYPAGSFAPIAKSRLAALATPSATASRSLAAPAQPAPAAPVARHAGVWEGLLSCGGSTAPDASEPDRKAWVDPTFRLQVDGAVLSGQRNFKAPNGRTGVQQFAGSVEDGGPVAISSRGVFTDAPDGKGFKIVFSGRVADAHLTAEGFIGNRPCTIDVVKSVIRPEGGSVRN